MTLKEFFVSLKGGTSLYHQKFQSSSGIESEGQLISGFISAISSFATRVFGENIREINLSNSKLVIQEIEDLYIVCVTGLEIQLEQIAELQHDIGVSIRKIITDIGGDPIAKLPIITAQIGTFVRESNFDQKFSNAILSKTEKQLKTTVLKDKSNERVVFLGLAKAGKSSIVEAFFNRKDIHYIENIPPTMGMKSFPVSIPFSSLYPPIQVLDLGGHEQFIENHLRSESLFRNTMNLFLIIDTQEPKTLSKAVDYFKRVLEIIANNSSQLPIVSIFLHKVDPGLSAVRSEIFWELTQTLFLELSSLNINWAVYQTSVYNQHTLDSSIVESFLRALPEDYIRQTLQVHDFIQIFDSLLPMTIVINSSKENEKIDSKIKMDVFSAAVLLGKSLGKKIRDNWINYIVKNNIKPISSVNSVFASIKRIGRNLEFSLIWPLPGQISESSYFPTIVSGILTGILSFSGSYKVERKCQEVLPGQFHCVFLGKKV